MRQRIQPGSGNQHDQVPRFQAAIFLSPGDYRPAQFLLVIQGDTRERPAAGTSKTEKSANKTQRAKQGMQKSGTKRQHDKVQSGSITLQRA